MEKNASVSVCMQCNVERRNRQAFFSAYIGAPSSDQAARLDLCWACVKIYRSDPNCLTMLTLPGTIIGGGKHGEEVPVRGG